MPAPSRKRAAALGPVSRTGQVGRWPEEAADVVLHRLGDVLGLIWWRVQFEVADTSWKLSKSYLPVRVYRLKLSSKGSGDVERLVVHLVPRRHVDRVRAALVRCSGTGCPA